MPYKSINFRSLGTNIEIKVFDDEREYILDSCKSMIVKYNQELNFYDDKSSLRKIKSGKNVLNKDLYDLISIGHKGSLDSNLNTNIYLGPLIALWDIGNDNNIPKDEEIEKLISYTNPNRVELHDTILTLPENYCIDLGSIAKGYISDKLKQFLIKENVASALINLGGNIYAHGFNLDRKDYFWHIGLQDASEARGIHIENLLINDYALVTSGISQRNFKNNGKLYHHILDSKTGMPVETDMTSITILSKSALCAEILSTGLFGKTFDEIKQACRKYKAEAYIQYKDKEVKFTDGFEKFLRRTYD